MRNGTRTRHRGVAAIAAITLLLLLQLLVIGMVLGGARDHHLTLRRVESVQAFYAGEAGINMAIRELSLDTDEDGDLDPTCEAIAADCARGFCG